ncbi:unnamed protein product, partial [marine sediment metagenome]
KKYNIKHIMNLDMNDGYYHNAIKISWIFMSRRSF